MWWCTWLTSFRPHTRTHRQTHSNVRMNTHAMKLSTHASFHFCGINSGEFSIWWKSFSFQNKNLHFRLAGRSGLQKEFQLIEQIGGRHKGRKIHHHRSEGIKVNKGQWILLENYFYGGIVFLWNYFIFQKTFQPDKFVVKLLIETCINVIASLPCLRSTASN